MASADEELTGVLTVTFNQDFSSLAVGSHSGYRLFSLNNVDKLEEIHQQTDCEDILVIERLFSSSLIAIVSQNSPRKLKVCHFKKGTEICNYSYSNSILAVRLNRQRLVVCLEESIYIHNIRDMKVLHTVRDTPPNPSGLLALSVSAEASFVAYPGSHTSGELQIFDALNLHATTVISAHNGPLAALSFNQKANMIATASEKGTVVRVFSIPEGEKLFEFRRGMKRCVQMSCLSFSLDSKFLVSASNTETVHVYKLDHGKARLEESEPDEGAASAAGWMDYMRSAVKTTQDLLLPTTVSEMLTQERAASWAKLPHVSESAQETHQACLTRVHDELCLLVVSSSGYLYVYNFDAENEGECILKKTHRLTDETLVENLPLLSRDENCTVASPRQRTHDPVSNATPPRGSQPYRDLDDEIDDEFPPDDFRLDDDGAL